MEKAHLKCVVVGDGNVGKTCLMKTFIDNCFPRDYLPTVFDNDTATIKVDGQTYFLGLWDTAGQEAYDRLRPLSYPQTDVFLVCFSISSKDSFQHVKGKWFPEVRYHCRDTPVVLVGTKLDCRNNSANNTDDFVTTPEAQQLMRQIGALYYTECSALTQTGVEKVFETAVRAALEPPPKKRRKCKIL